jgi:flavorubredoxin
MQAYAISDSVYCLHADICTTDLFEGIWSIKDFGVSLNSYIVKGEKIALIDLFKDWNDAPAQIRSELSSIGVDISSIDYLILNHLEPDHTGWLKEFRALNPRCEIIATAKGVKLIPSFYGVTENLRAVKDGDALDLGGGQTLLFIEAPNVHWPETMFTWHAGSGTLFSCDAFGSFGSLGDRVFDDSFDSDELARFEGETLRYYASIVSSFSAFVERAAQKIAPLPVKVAAPSHGIVWRKDPARIINLYVKYAAYAKGQTEKEVAVIWGSMYGNTKAGLDAVVRGIEAEGVPCTLVRVPDEDASCALAAAYKSAALVIAMPTYEYAMFPPVAYIIDLFRRKHIFNKTVLRIGSFGWVGGAKREYEAAIEPLKWTSLESREWAGFPGAKDLAALEESGRCLARAVKGESAGA